MEPRLQIVALLAAGGLLVLVLELVRSRRLLERYALLWLLSALVLVGLAAWTNLLEDIARAIGIAYPPTALFVIAFGFTLLLLLHYSVAVSRQADQSKVLAQRVALLEQRLRSAERQLAASSERTVESERAVESEHRFVGEEFTATGDERAQTRVRAAGLRR